MGFVVYLIFAIVAGVVGLLWPSVDVGDIPFFQLTPKMVSDYIIKFGSYSGAIYFLGKSLAQDRIWPWRWGICIEFLGWLREKSAERAIRAQIRRRKRLGYDTTELDRKLEEIVHHPSREEEEMKEIRRSLGYRDKE